MRKLELNELIRTQRLPISAIGLIITKPPIDITHTHKSNIMNKEEKESTWQIVRGQIDESLVRRCAD